jgi:hypothetical protein
MPSGRAVGTPKRDVGGFVLGRGCFRDKRNDIVAISRVIDPLYPREIGGLAAAAIGNRTCAAAMRTRATSATRLIFTALRLGDPCGRTQPTPARYRDSPFMRPSPLSLMPSSSKSAAEPQYPCQNRESRENHELRKCALSALRNYMRMSSNVLLCLNVAVHNLAALGTRSSGAGCFRRTAPCLARKRRMVSGR